MKPTMFALPITLLAVVISATAQAGGVDAEIRALREQMQALNQRLDELEKSNIALREESLRLRRASEQPAAAVEGVTETANAAAEQAREKSSIPSWVGRIGFKGDFRLRYENIDQEGKADRSRDRMRARAAIVAHVTDHVKVGLGLASGSDDPVSTNQTLGGGGSSKELNLDLAYFQWSGLRNTRITGGKFKNVWYKPGTNALLWDGDWNPEGIALSWADGAWFANAMGTWLESDSKKEKEFSYGLQAGLKKTLGDGVNLTAGMGYYDFGTRGKGTFYGDDDEFFGNSFDPSTRTYRHDYQVFELFADLGFELGGKPAALFFDYIQNQDAPAFDRGYAAGFNYGKAGARGTWQLGYTWQDLEADAAFGLLVDSDFGGGGTDGRGHILRAGYAIARNWVANASYFINEIGADLGVEKDYDRLQLDLAFKY